MKLLKLEVALLCVGMAGLCLSGCSTVEKKYVDLNSPVDRSFPMDIQFKMPSRGWVSFHQKFKGRPKHCEQVAARIRIHLMELGKGGREIPLEPLCEDSSKTLFYRSKEVMAPGEYRLTLASRLKEEHMDAKPKLLVEYVDPDFKSGPDQLPTGARILEKNASLSGQLNPTAGVRTSWLQVAGSSGTATVGYTAEEGSQISVTAYRMNSDLKPQQILKKLKSREEVKFELDSNLIFLKVVAPDFNRELDYSVFRRDTAAAPPKSVLTVLERYALSSSQAIFILRASEALKLDVELLVSGAEEGKSVQPLGKCKITAIQDSQANCRLDGVDITGLNQFEIQAMEAQ